MPIEVIRSPESPTSLVTLEICSLDANGGSTSKVLNSNRTSTVPQVSIESVGSGHAHVEPLGKVAVNVFGI